MARPWKHPKSGVYYFRRAIPEGLRPFVPKGHAQREYKRSLQTKDARLAKRLYADAALVCDDYFAELRGARERASRAPVVQAHGTRGGVEGSSNEAPGAPSPVSLRTLAGELGQEILARNAGGPPVEAAFRLGRSVPPGPWGAKGEPWTHHRYVLALSQRNHEPAASVEFVTTPAREFLQGRFVTLFGEQRWEEFCELARDAIDAALEALQRRYREGDTSDAPLARRFNLVAPAVKGTPSVSIKGLFDTWAAVRPAAAAKTNTRTRYKRRLREFSAFVKHDDASRVTSKDLRAWRDYLSAKGKAARTINGDCIAIVKAVFKVAEAEGVLAAFPFTGSYSIEGGSAKSDKRRPYEPGEAAQVLLAARRETSPLLHWMPSVLAYTGARPVELIQLRRENVKQRGGIHFIEVNDVGEDKNVKTSSSVRDVP